jgi:hypothetical protein
VAELRSWFLRDVLDSLERERGAAALERLTERLPPRLQPRANVQRLRASGPSDTIGLDEGEELLLAIDAVLGDGSGKVLETVATELFSRTLSFGGLKVSSGDLLGTVARLQAPLERPFVGAQVMFDLVETDTGFSLTVGIRGRPRSGRLLRHLAMGAIRAAHRLAHEPGASDLKLYAETLGDRASLSARYHAAKELLAAQIVVPESRRPSRRMRAITLPRLSEEIERILGPTPSSPPINQRATPTDPVRPPSRSAVPAAKVLGDEASRAHEASENPDESDDDTPPSSKRG